MKTTMNNTVKSDKYKNMAVFAELNVNRELLQNM